MSIQQKIEKAQVSKVVFEIAGNELAEFVKQLTASQMVQQPVAVSPSKPTDLTISNKPIHGLSKADKTLHDTVLKLAARVKSLENVIFENKQVLNTDEAAIFLGVSKSSLYKMTHAQTIPFYKPNNKLLYFERSELMKWLRSARVSTMEEIEELAKQKLRELALK